ncbi:hypothetical protein KJA16_02395 [Patescibacteria group bacterium]|nr:hypothetical protein [Patescibacteria group bacterium]
MTSDSFFKKILPLILFIIPSLLLIANHALSSNGTTQLRIEITAPAPVCGDGVREGSEQCDKADLGGETCESRGYTGGTLSCNDDCTFDTSDCTSPGGGGGWVPPPVETKVILKGKAFPGSEVHILKDGKEITITKADSKANFEKEITEITPGIYTFGLWVEDKDGIKSITYTLTFRVTSNVITTVSGIFLPPTIGIDKTSLSKGETLNIFGQTVPEVEVNVHILSPEIVTTTTSDEIGAWLLPFNTKPLDEGAHITKARSQLSAEERSGFGKVLTFYIGEVTVPLEEICRQSDFSEDGRVNLVDFSILLSWWEKANPRCDLNQNGIVDLADFSILLSCWTG